MSIEKYELETHYEVHNNNTGDCIKIGPDRNGFGLVEVRSIECDGREICITMNHEQAKLVGRALSMVESVE